MESRPQQSKHSDFAKVHCVYDQFHFSVIAYYS